ncbi:MAG: beta-ketoacyl-ACP synthase II [Planctomycetota bacterium]
MTKRRVVVTGLGLVSPVGVGCQATWDSLLAGRSGIRTIQKFDIADHACRIGGEVWDFHPEEFVDSRLIKRMDPFTQYAAVASVEAMRDAGIDMDKEDPSRIACIMGTGIGGIHELESQKERLMEKAPRFVSPLLVPRMMFNAFTGMIALMHGLKGQNFATGSACASASHALGVALRTIQYGDADVVVSGGAEHAMTPLSLAGFTNMKAVSRRNAEPDRASRPFDRDRDGFVMGDGGGVVVLEERERALKRGAPVYAELLGFGASDDAFHMTAPDESAEGPVRAMECALRDAGVDPDRVGYVNAHGTSTPLNDKTETQALKILFGDHARKLQISSTKSMIGHLLGASGAIEFAAVCLSLHHGKLHPTINYETPDPDCDLDYVPGEAREAQVACAISNSFGFGGTNACLVAARHDG